ncbi:MAG: ammonium transporter [Planctomycetota bacterium]
MNEDVIVSAVEAASVESVAEAAAISGADTAWILVSTALVLLMTPAVGLFYGGLVRKKNVLSTLMYSFFTVAIVSVVWVLAGYSLAFGSSVGGFIGGLDHIGLHGVGTDPIAGQTIPALLFMAFQMTFAIITPALISGAFVERKAFGPYIAFTSLWSLVVYAPVAHWVWGGGFLSEDGALDYAGGTVVHITSGVSALVCAWVIGRRDGLGSEKIEPHNATMTVLGASLLWFGWFGFNAGSALAADGAAANALVTTNSAAAMGAIVWLAIGAIHHKRPSVIGAAVGAVAGLVGITPAAGFVSPMSALAIGALTSGICYVVTEFLVKGRIDDALDVFGVHGVGGIVGALLTGVFASEAIGGTAGAIEGNWMQVLIQAKAVLAAAIYAGVLTFVILKVIELVAPIRVSPEQESQGLDLTVHGEHAYDPA